MCVLVYDLNGSTKYNELFYWATFLFLTCIAGFRYRLGIDTIAYMQIFESEIPLLSNFLYYYKMDMLPFEIGSSFIFSLGKTLSDSWDFTQFLIAIITNVSIFTFAYKNSDYKFTFILLYFIFLFFDLNYETLRQALALSIALYAFQYLKTKSYLLYYILSILAISCHIVALMLLIIPWLQIQFNKKVLIILSISIFLTSSIIWALSENAVSFIDSLGIEFLTNKTTGYLTGSWALDEAGINSNWKGWLMSFILLPLQCILLIFCVKTNSSIATHKFLMPFFLLWCILIPIQKILPVTYRFVEFIYPFIFIVFAEIIITTLKNKYSYRHFALCILIMILLYSRVYQRFFTIDSIRHSQPRLVSCYPYANTFTKENNDKREIYYREVGR